MKLKKMNILLGIHIPLEICEKCKRKCENFGKMDHVQHNRKKIAEYVRQMQIMNVYSYNTPFEMHEKLGFTLATPNFKGCNYSIDSSMVIIDVVDKNQLCICVIDSLSEEVMLEELKNNNKINYFFNISKEQQKG